MAVDNTHFKGSWRPEEDAALRESVSRHGEKNWSTVARTFNQLMGRPPLLGRAPKQCRSRYLQQLVPGIKTGEWSLEEEEILVEGHKQFGNQWTLIASMLPGRTETSVKNHYNCTARRKVPSDPNRMTILQRYLAAIGVITAPNSKGGAAKYPSLGSGYPNSNSGMFFQTTSSAAAVAAATAAAKAAGRKQGASTSAAAHSPSTSHLGYDEYDGAELAHTYSEADYSQAYAAYQAYQSLEQQHMMAATVAAAAAMQEPVDDEVDDDEVDDDDDEAAAEGAADGLLQLAHAALMHLEQLEADGEADEDEERQAAGSGKGKGSADRRLRRPAEGKAAVMEGIAEEYADNEQQQDQGPRTAGVKMEATAAASKAGSKSPAGKSLPAWIKPELALSVMSSEESDRTAEEPDEGSPLAEQLLRHHLKAGSKRSSPNTAGAGQPAASTAPIKRSRSMWGSQDLAAAAIDPAAAAACAAPLPNRNRPVLDVSQPQGCAPLCVDVSGNASSPAVPSVGSSSAPISELNAHLVAMLMGAFMGAADSTAASAPAASLPTEALAAIARVMASSMSSLAMAGQQQQQHGVQPATQGDAGLPVSGGPIDA